MVEWAAIFPVAGDYQSAFLLPVGLVHDLGVLWSGRPSYASPVERIFVHDQHKKVGFLLPPQHSWI